MANRKRSWKIRKLLRLIWADKIEPELTILRINIYYFLDNAGAIGMAPVFYGIIFNILNMSKNNPYSKIGELFRHISHPTRLRILQEIGEGEACVCHLEAQLGLRQAYLSQHLMALRDAHILVTERDGRFIYYRLADPALLQLINSAADILGVQGMMPSPKAAKKSCPCPKCNQER